MGGAAIDVVVEKPEGVQDDVVAGGAVKNGREEGDGNDERHPFDRHHLDVHDGHYHWVSSICHRQQLLAAGQREDHLSHLEDKWKKWRELVKFRLHNVVVAAVDYDGEGASVVEEGEDKRF